LKKKKEISSEELLEREESAPEQTHAFLEAAEKSFKQSSPGLHDLMKRVQGERSKNGPDQSSDK